MLHARTKDNTGNELGVFTAATRPTAEQVEKLIDQAVGEIVMRVACDMPTEFVAAAREAAVLRTVMFIELGYYPEHGTGADRTTYTSARLTYNEVLEALSRNVQWWVLAGSGSGS